MAKDSALLVATVADEGPNILEWVAHHRLCGFDRIQIYQSDGTDTTLQSLRLLDRIGAIEFHNNRRDRNAHPMRTYRRASRSEAYRNSTWCMALDANEFLNVKTGDRSVHALLGTCPDDATAVLVPWRVFGSNGLRALSGELTTERFTRAEPAADIRHIWTPFKSIFRTDAYNRPGVHLPRDPCHTAQVTCNASGLAENAFTIKNARTQDPGLRKFGQVNRYALRDLPSFLLEYSRTSGDIPDRELGLRRWQRHDRNEEEDQSLASHAFELWAEMKRLDLLADGKLLRLRRRGLRQWRLALNALLKADHVASLRDAILSNALAAPSQAHHELPPNTPVFSSSRKQSLLSNVTAPDLAKAKLR